MLGTYKACPTRAVNTNMDLHCEHEVERNRAVWAAWYYMWTQQSIWLDRKQSLLDELPPPPKQSQH